MTVEGLFGPRARANTSSSESFPSGLAGPMNTIKKPWLTEKDQEAIQDVRRDAERRQARRAIVSALNIQSADAIEPAEPETSEASALRARE